MTKLYKLVENFRNSLDIAFENDEFYKLPPFSNFPYNCCDLTCDLLGKFLFDNGIETTQINGCCVLDNSLRHVWLVTKNETVIDITGDQFINKLVNSSEVNKIHIGPEGKIHKLFINDRIKEINTIFDDKNKFENINHQPNFRQKKLIDVYNIVVKYL